MAINCHVFLAKQNGHPNQNMTYLLKEQLGSVRNRQRRHLFRTLAIGTPPVITHQATLLAGIYFESVR